MVYADLLGGLAGCWRLVRDVSTRSGALVARMDGRATFSPDTAAPPGSACRYLEEGNLIMAGGMAGRSGDKGGEAIAFSRSYIYDAWEQGLDIRFDDAERRLFQRVALTAARGGLEGEAQHLCQPDTYRSRYRFAMPLTFEIAHAVEGPRKDYVIRSRYSRIVA